MKKKKILLILALLMTAATGAWADGVATLTQDGSEWYVNMLTTGTNTLTITADDITAGKGTFKVYDNGGKDGNYSPSCNGYLVLTVPEGYRLKLSGSVRTETVSDYLTVYDGSNNQTDTLVNQVSSSDNGTETDIPTIISTGQSMTICFYSNNSGSGNSEFDGLDLTVTLIDLNKNIVTKDNFNDYFDDNGNLLESITSDVLIFKGDFENLVDRIYIMTPLTITGDEAVLYNIGFEIDSSDEVTLDHLTFIADKNLGSLINIIDSYDVSLTNLDITYDGGDEEAVAIDVVSDYKVNILNNTISFESHVPDDSKFAIGLKLTDCFNVLVDGNTITTQLPCVYTLNYDEDYYIMGSDRVNAVRLKGCTGLVFKNNIISSTTNDYTDEFPTIQAIQIIGCHDSVLDHNNISLIDEKTPVGLDNYLYGINFGCNSNVTFSNNNFNMSTKGASDGAGVAYAFQSVESEVNIIGNSITSISNGPNLGIYVASMYGVDSNLIIEDNFIKVTGFASSSGSWALVSGIEIQNGDAKIYNNTVYTYNVNEYDENAYMYGISYAQWMYGDRSFDIQGNTVYTEGKYAISVINATSLNVVKNALIAHELYGDDSVNPGECANANIEKNLHLTASGINDDINNALKGKTVNISFGRTFEALSDGEGKASTLCLPFDLDKPSMTDVGTFYTFGGVSSDATGEYVVTMTEETATTLSAGTPYMFRPATGDEVTFQNEAYTVPATGFTPGTATDDNGWQFKGTYEEKTWDEGQTRLYGFAASDFEKKDGTKLNDVGAFRRFNYGTCAAFRCYLLAPGASGARGMSKAGNQLPESMKVVLISASGETTAIGTLDTRTGEVVFGDEWYDLNGRRLNAQPTTNGLYINNGRKVAIK